MCVCAGQVGWNICVISIRSQRGSFQNWSVCPENNDTDWYPFHALERLVVIASILFPGNTTSMLL